MRSLRCKWGNTTLFLMVFAAVACSGSLEGAVSAPSLPLLSLSYDGSFTSAKVYLNSGSINSSESITAYSDAFDLAIRRGESGNYDFFAFGELAGSGHDALTDFLYWLGHPRSSESPCQTTADDLMSHALSTPAVST